MIDQKLYTLLAVDKYKNYTKAAASLSLTQPAVSQHIRQIENEMNVRLFNRSGNEIKTTTAGDLIIQYAQRNIALYENLHQTILDEGKNIRRLTVGVTHTAESNAVAEVLGKYSRKNPNTSITIITDSINNLYRRLMNYEIDLAVVEGATHSDKINSLLLDTDSLVLVVSNNHPFAKKSRVTIDDLKKEPMILRSSTSATRNLFAAHLESQNLYLEDFHVIMEVDNIATIKDLIRRDVGISILPRSVCLDELKKGKIAVLPIENLSMIREINIVYNKDFQHTDILDTIIKDYNKVVKFYSSI